MRSSDMASLGLFAAPNGTELRVCETAALAEYYGYSSCYVSVSC